MAGASKQRARKQRKNGDDNNDDKNGKSSDSPETQQASSSSESPPQRHSPPSGWDGNRDPTTSVAQPTGPTTAVQMTRNMDLGLRNSFLMHGGEAPTDLAPRPNALNTSGRAITVKLNTWHAKMQAGKTVHQYDVVVGSGNEKRGLIMRVWECKTVQDALGPGWIFDRNKIAYWNQRKPETIRLEIDMDKEDNKPPRVDANGNKKPNKHVFRLTWAKQVPMQNLDAYLTQKASWDTGCLESMTFLDRLMRESPSKHLTMIKRNFFHHGRDRFPLGNAAEAMKGVYVTIRPVLTQLGHPATLSVNVDVANTTFWHSDKLMNAARDMLNIRDVAALTASLRPTGRGDSPSFTMLRRLRRVRVLANYRSTKANPLPPDEFVIDKFLPITPREKKFMVKEAPNGPERQTNVEAYITEKYKTRLSYPDLPLVKMTKGQDTCIPMELLTVKENQRYAFKLSDKQTANMIKFAVTVPKTRWDDIEHGVGMLDWRNDRYLANYGLQIGSPAQVSASILPPPKVAFAGGGNADPKTSGRWDLRGKRFLETNATPLKSWGVCVVSGGPGGTNIDRNTALNFISNFIRVYEGHGGKVANKQPTTIQGDSRDAAKCVELIWNAAGNAAQAPPQLLVFIVPDRNTDFYNRIKKSTDCRYGVVSQVLQAMHVVKNQAQYCSNVAMKVNAKLGGITARAQGVKGTGSWFTKPTMIIGADVSHGAPGTNAASIAALTMSWDRAAVRYVAVVQTNGRRVEMITPENWSELLTTMYTVWVKTVGGGRSPQHIIYLRDGVSEGQYSQVLSQELKGMQDVIAKADPAAKPQYTVLTCTKRHHVRFFPQGGAGDKNGNPQPGTLVEQGVTDPRDWDFYLCAHSAIKGTARPVHYTVLRDDAKHAPMALQNMLYEASYQYVRSTTPVSLHPAIYYAHLAAMRANAHINRPSESSGNEDQSRTGPSEVPAAEVPKLLPMPNTRGIKGVMWFV